MGETDLALERNAVDAPEMQRLLIVGMIAAVLVVGAVLVPSVFVFLAAFIAVAAFVGQAVLYAGGHRRR